MPGRGRGWGYRLPRCEVSGCMQLATAGCYCVQHSAQMFQARKAQEAAAAMQVETVEQPARTQGPEE